MIRSKGAVNSSGNIKKSIKGNKAYKENVTMDEIKEDLIICKTRHPPRLVLPVFLEETLTDHKDEMVDSFPKDLQIEKELGKGAYACVKLAYHMKLEKYVALKIYDKEKLIQSSRQRSVQREIKIMRIMSNPHIVKLYDSFETNDKVILMMEYVKGTNIYDYLKLKPEHKLVECEAKRIFKQIVIGINYCHEHWITHRDIKLENILLNERNDVKIIDFGFSTCVDNKKKVKVFCGTPTYMAPEIILHKESIGPPVDIWALGVLLYTMLCGKFPFRATNDQDLYREIINSHFQLPCDLSEPSKVLISKMLQIDPQKRPSSMQILLDDWLNDCDKMIEISNCNIKAIEQNKRYLANSCKNYTTNEPTFSNKKIMEKNLSTTHNDIIESLYQLGYTNNEIEKGLKDESSHIILLYNNIKKYKKENKHISRVCNGRFRGISKL